MKKSSKLLALLLAVAMIVTLLPVTVFADEAPAETAEPAAVEETADVAEAPAEETPSEAPAEEVKQEETPAEPAAEVPAAEVSAEEAKPEEAPAEAKTAEAAPVAPETAEKTETLVGDDEVGTVTIDSQSDYATFTRTLTTDDIAAKARGNVIKATNAAGGVRYYTDLSTANLKTEGMKAQPGRVITFLDDITSVSTSSTPAIQFPTTAGNWGNAYLGDMTIDLNGYTWTVTGEGKVATSGVAGYTIRNGRIIADGNTNTIFNLGSTAGTSAISTTPCTVNYENLVVSAKTDFVCSYSMLMTINISNCDIWGNGGRGLLRIGNIKSNFNDGVQESCVNIDHSFLAGGLSAAYVYTSMSSGSTQYGVSDLRTIIDFKDSVMCYSGNFTSYEGNIAKQEHIMQGTATHNDASVAYTPRAPFDTEVTGLSSYEGDFYVCYDYNPVATKYTVTFLDDDGVTTLNTALVVEDGTPASYAAPDKGNYVFDYWTTEGDDTHYSAFAIASYVVTQDVTFTAHYKERSPAASFTPDGGEETIYNTFMEAWNASVAANGAGVITLYDDVVIADNEAVSDSRTINVQVNANIDFNGHYILSTRGNVFHVNAANVTLDFRNGAIIGASATNAGYSISMGGFNATVYLTDMDLYNICTYSSAGTTINLQSGSTQDAKGTVIAENCRFFAKRANATMTFYGASDKNVTRFIDATFTDCTFVSTSATAGTAIGDYHIEEGSVFNLTYSGSNVYYSKYASPAMSPNKAFYVVNAEDCAFAKTTDETWDYTDRYTTAGERVTVMLGDPSQVTGMTKLTQMPAVNVMFFDDNDELITTKLVAVGSSLTEPYAAPDIVVGTDVKTFSYWTVEGDEDTHYSAEDLTTYIIDDETNFYAHYELLLPVASYTDIDDNVTFYMTLEEAIAASNAQNGSGAPKGKVTLLRDYTNDTMTGANNAYVNRFSQSIEIDFNGHVYNVPHCSAFMFEKHSSMEPDQRRIVYLHGGTIMGMQENYKTDTPSSTYYTGYAPNCNGALLSQNSSDVNSDFTLENMNIICLSPNGSSAISICCQKEATPRSTYTLRNCVVIDSTSYAIQIVGTDSGKYNYADITLTGTTVVELGTRRAFSTYRNPAGYTLDISNDCVLYSSAGVFINEADAAYGTVTYADGYSLAPTDGLFSLEGLLDNADLQTILEQAPVYTGDVAAPTITPASDAVSTATKYIFKQSATVTWMLGDDVIRTDSVAYGDTPAAPTASDLAGYAFDTLVGWTDTQGSSDCIEIPTVTGNATYYAVTSVNTAPTAETKVGMQIGSGAMYYYSTLTRAMTIAMAQSEPVVIDLLANISMDHSTDECGTTSATANFWFVFPAGTDLTLNLNGFTLSGGTDDTMYSATYAYRDRGVLMSYCNANDFNLSLTIVGGEGETKGTLMTTGQRNIIGLSNTENTVSCAQVDINATNVVFRRTSKEFTNNLISVNSHTDTHSVSLTFNNCEFVEESPVINSAIAVTNAANIGDVPAYVQLSNCSFSGIKYAVSVYKDAVGSHPNKTTPQITIDAATAQNVISEMDGALSHRIYLSKAVVGDAETLIVDPATVVRTVYTPIFKLDKISMSLQDYVYVNVKPNDAWTTEYSAVTSLTGDEPISGTGELQIENLPITAKEMDQNVIYTIFAVADATTRYLSGTVGSIDSFATKTADAADASTEKGAALITAMNALKTYGDWAAYNFDTTGEIAAPAAVEYDVSGIDAITFVGSAKPAAGVAGLYGVSSVLSDQLYLKYYFYNVTDLADKTTVTPSDTVAAEYGTDGSGVYGYVKLKIMPKYFDTDYTVTVSDGGKTYGATGCLAGYAAMLTEQGTVKEQTLAKALLAYCDAAKTYFELG